MNGGILLDSHVFVWLAYKPDALSTPSIAFVVEQPKLYISVVSLMELAFKHASGKFAYDTDDLLEAAESLGAIILPIDTSHLQRYADIVTPHKDPFDRLLLAQATSENLTLVTADTQLLATSYPTFDARI